MVCHICGHNNFKTIFEYSKPDKYEEWCRITNLVRSWNKCYRCGFHQKSANYPHGRLDLIYKDGYRSEEFRGANIEDEFNKIFYLPLDESENYYRLLWFENHVALDDCSGTILDIGSGLGVWPKLLLENGWKVESVEPNKDSAKFIKEKLNIHCFEEFFDASHQDLYDIVSLMHVLEHIETHDRFLSDVRRCLHPEGELFIEVPDAIEFNRLPKDHDEFNSTHIHFFDIPSLCKLVERNGFSPKSIHRVHYDKRNLDRIMMVCTSC